MYAIGSIFHTQKVHELAGLVFAVTKAHFCHHGYSCTLCCQLLYLPHLQIISALQFTSALWLIDNFCWSPFSHVYIAEPSHSLNYSSYTITVFPHPPNYSSYMTTVFSHPPIHTLVYSPYDTELPPPHTCNWIPSSCTSSLNITQPPLRQCSPCMPWTSIEFSMQVLEWSTWVHLQNKREIGKETGLETKLLTWQLWIGEVHQSGTRNAELIVFPIHIANYACYCDCLCLNNLPGFKILKSESNWTTYERHSTTNSSNKSAMASPSPFHPNKWPYHMPPQQHSWPVTVDPSTIVALSQLTPLLSPAEVATNNIHNPVQQIPQENVVQSIDGTSIGSVVSNDAVGPSVAITQKPLAPSPVPSHNFASCRRLKVMLILVESQHELTFFKVPPSSLPGINRPQVPASMGIVIVPHAPPSTSIGVADLPHNSKTNPYSRLARG